MRTSIFCLLITGILGIQKRTLAEMEDVDDLAEALVHLSLGPTPTTATAPVGPDFEGFRKSFDEIQDILARQPVMEGYENFVSDSGLVMSVRKGTFTPSGYWGDHWTVPESPTYRIAAIPESKGTAATLGLVEVTRRANKYGLATVWFPAIGQASAEGVKLLPIIRPAASLLKAMQASPLRFHDALVFGRGIIASLKTLHMEAGIVHGSLIPEFINFDRFGKLFFRFNWASTFLDSSGKAVYAADYGPLRQRSIWVCHPSEVSETPTIPSRMGDIHAAYAVISWMIRNPDSYVRPVGGASVADWLEWKRVYQFAPPVIGSHVPEETANRILSLHQQIVELVLAPIDEQPQYDTIIGLLTEMIDVAANIRGAIYA